MIIRSDDSKFRVSRAIIADTRLDGIDIAILVYLLEKGDSWQWRETDIRNFLNRAKKPKEKGVGKKRVQDKLRKLKNLGYLKSEDYRRPNGQWNWRKITIESPDSMESCDVDLRLRGAIAEISDQLSYPIADIEVFEKYLYGIDADKLISIWSECVKNYSNVEAASRAFMLRWDFAPNDNRKAKGKAPSYRKKDVAQTDDAGAATNDINVTRDDTGARPSLLEIISKKKNGG